MRFDAQNAGNVAGMVVVWAFAIAFVWVLGLGLWWMTMQALEACA